jgi:hypothetical protein
MTTNVPANAKLRPTKAVVAALAYRLRGEYSIGHKQALDYVAKRMGYEGYDHYLTECGVKDDR